MSPIKRTEKKPLKRTRRVWNPPEKGYGANTPASPLPSTPASESGGEKKESNFGNFWKSTKDAAREHAPKGFGEVKYSKFVGAILILLITGYLFRGNTIVVWSIGIIVTFILLSFLVKILYSFLPESVAGMLVWLGKIAIIIMVFYVGGTFAYGAYQAGGIDFFWAKADEAGVEKGVRVFSSDIRDFISSPFLKIYSDFSDWGEPDSVEKEEKQGIEFTKLSSRRDYFDEGSPIIIEGTIKVDALENEDTTVSFECGVEKLNKTGKLILRGMEGNSFNVYAGKNEIVDFECMVEGVEFTGGVKSNEPGNEEMRIFVIDIKGFYNNYENQGVLKVYNIRNEDLRNIKNPEDEIKDPLFDKSGRRMKSQCLSGCGLTRVALKTSVQPQTNVGTYSLGIALATDSDYYGDIYELNSLEILLPDNFELVKCDGLGGNNILEKGDPLFNDMNDRIKKGYGSTNDYSFYCDYRIVRPYVERIDASEILVITNYDYMVDAKKTVNVKQQRAGYVPSSGGAVEDEEYGDYEIKEGTYTYD